MSFTYEYDAANQLIRENLYYGSGNSNNATYTYEYDAWGNILNKKKYAYTTGALGSVQNTVSYGYSNNAWKDKLTSYNGQSISYDSMGNPTNYLGANLTWRGKQLTGYSKIGTSVTYAYNEDGLRTRKTVNGTDTDYYYNGSLLMAMTDGSITQRFSYDAQGKVVSVNYNGTEYYYIRNAQGDIVKLIDGSGSTVVEYTYDSWGKILAVTGTLATTLGENQPFRYRGYVYDTETGWYYLQSRYYDPTTCRFISSDVYLSTGQGVLGSNSYAYCLNNPINQIDPLGTFSWGGLLSCIGIVAVAAVAVVATVATAGAAGAAIGAAAGAYLGASAATAAAVSTTVTVGAYCVAGGIAACAASDVGEVVTGTNVIRDHVMGGNQGVYDATKAALYVASYATTEIGTAYQATFGNDIGSKTTAEPACFIAGTLVKTESVAKPIETIAAGDYVYAADPETGESGYKRVVQTFAKETYELIKVKVDGETITTTPTHPFYVPQKGWTEAVQLRAGDILVTCNGEYVVVELVQYEILETPVTVFNFEVEDFHTYYVAANEDAEFVLVHNKCGVDAKELSDSELRNFGEPGKNSGFRTTKGSHNDAMSFVKTQTKSLSEYAPGKYVGYNSRGIEFRVYAQVRNDYTSIRINGVVGLKGIKFLWK